MPGLSKRILAGAALVATLAALSGCPKRVESPTAILDEAAEAAGSPSAGARELALAGWHAWLVRGELALAQERFDAALAKDAAEPWALYGQLLWARRRGHPDRALEAALKLVQAAPAHPLSAAAARYALDLAGTSTALDERILSGARAALGAQPAGDAAHLLRTALTAILAHRPDVGAHAQAVAELGSATAWSLSGPFSAHHLLDFDTAPPPLATGAVDPRARVLPFPSGRISLAGEQAPGDLYVLAVDLEVSEAADYLVRSVSHASHRAVLDGTPLFERRAFARAASSVSARGVRLEPGVHRLMVLVARDNEDASLSVSVVRSDGAPAALRFRPAAGPAPSWTGVPLVDARGSFPGAAAYAKALEAEVGPLLAGVVAIRDGMGRDADGARRLMSALEQARPEVAANAALLALRAELWLSDRTIPSRVALGRATRDLERALELDPKDVWALLTRAQLALDDGRQAQASTLHERAVAQGAPVGYPVWLLRARLDLALGLDAQAQQSAAQALSVQPGLCEALALQYDLARRRDAIAEADERVQQLEGCPGSRTRLAEHARSRGRVDEAIARYERLVAQDPAAVQATDALAGLYVAARRFPDAVRLLEGARKVWPHHAGLARRLADVLDHAQQPKAALAMREEALRLGGGDLALRRTVHRQKTGKELLSEHAIDAAEAIARYEANPGTEDAQSVLVLDAAAVQAFADGSMVDRIHVIQKALSQEGVSQIAEVTIPGGAVVLKLRTLKKDGTVLEPEHIAEKDSISMPAVQVGDYVQQEYLLAHPPRGPAQPGFTAVPFYFQVAGTPNHWSTYVVTAPKELGMRVDAHNVKSPQPKLEGDQSVYRHDEKRVPPYIPEPDAPPNATEYLPFVQLGAGTTGNDALVQVYSDAFLDRGQLTWEVESFARKAAGGKEGLEAVRAVHAAVMQALPGQDHGLPASASFSLAQERGSRLWALKASLEALGIPARVAAVRTFHADPNPWLFPNEALLPYVALRAQLPDGSFAWLDTAVRYGPFGQLPPAAQDQEAWLFAEPGRPLEKVRTPRGEAAAHKQVTLKLVLGGDGTLSGEGEERYTGFDAAQLAEGLEQLPPDQRKQALQGVLARYFGGAELGKLELELRREVGADLVVRYAFRAPGFARAEGRGWVLGAVTFPVELGRRYLQLGSRTTPLFIDPAERTRTVVTLQLPAGHELRGPVGEVRLQEDFGQFIRRERQEGDVVHIEEEYALQALRLPPERYERFSHFAGQVDLLQTRDLLVKKTR